MLVGWRSAFLASATPQKKPAATASSRLWMDRELWPVILLNFKETSPHTKHLTKTDRSRRRMDQIRLANWALWFSLFVRFSPHWESMHDVKLPKFPQFCGVCMCLVVLSQIDSKNMKNPTIKMIHAQFCICVDRNCLRLHNRAFVWPFECAGHYRWLRGSSAATDTSG